MSMISATAFGQGHLYVALDGAHQPPFDSWATAATNIQAAVDLAAEGDVVWVGNGVYSGAGGVYGSGQFRSTNVVSITKGIRLRGVNGPDHVIIDGAHLYRGVLVSNANATVSGFTIRNGAPHGPSSGAGLHLTHGSAEWLVVVSNSTMNGLYGTGGGVYANEASLSNVVVAYNVSSESGGGIAAEKSTLDRCRIVHNTTGGNGGGVYSVNPTTIRNSVVARNRARVGGGLFLLGSTVENVTVTENMAIEEGGGIHIAPLCTLRNAIVWGNFADVAPEWHSLGIEFIAERIVTRPLAYFMDGFEQDPRLIGSGNHEFSLAPDSPCINAGSFLAWMSQGVDLVGNPRITQSVVDIGAYETNYSNTLMSIIGNAGGGALPATLTFDANVIPSGTGWVGDVWFAWDFDGDQNPDVTGWNTSRVDFTYLTLAITPRP